jgi:integrase
MSVHYEPERDRWVVRWRQAGKHRSRRFPREAEARQFDASLRPTAPKVAPVGDGVYPYATRAGVRFRFMFRHSDGSVSTRRGFTSRRAAVIARRHMIESIERGEVKVARTTFGAFWAELLEERRPYLTAGSYVETEIHGRKRLLPMLADIPLARLDETVVRRWIAAMAKEVEAGRWSSKTINNARTQLSVTLNHAVRRGLIPRNPCAQVRALPVERVELDYLRLNEIGRYVDACAPYYELLARTLIGTGARISEALALQFRHVDLAAGLVTIAGQRPSSETGVQPTKGKRVRSVQVGSALLEAIDASQAARGAGENDWLFLCPIPRRGQYSGRMMAEPPSRKTVHDWHEAALVDAGLRDMPLHALRHTAAAAWLATGHPLIFVQRQLGHRSITTTEEHYGHLEQSYVREAVERTEQTISAATSRPGRPILPRGAAEAE